MPDNIFSLLLVFLEMTFIFTTLALLFNQRRSIGQAPFYLAFGFMVIFARFVTAADIRAVMFGTIDFSVGEVICYLPLLAAYLMVYITGGTLPAQHLIIAMTALYGFFLYIGEVTRLECSWLGFSISTGISGGTFDQLLSASRISLGRTSMYQLLCLFVAPMIYTKMTNLRLPRWLNILGSLLTAQALMLAMGLLLSGTRWSFSRIINGDVVAGLAANFWLTLLLWIYLARLEHDVRSGEESPLEIFFAFFGSYRHTKELEANLREWEDRYRVVLENAGEMILMLDTNGKVIDANIAAGKLAGRKSLIGRPLYPRLRVFDPEKFAFQPPPDSPVSFRCRVDEGSGSELALSVSLSPIRLRGRQLLVMIARDITEELRLAAEKEALSEQLIHSQRLESLGMLAGGVAHDFNNYIHAIIGHVDVAMMIDNDNPEEVTHHLEKIAGIAEKAGLLTNQLLGFARKGKYMVVDVDIRQLFDDCLALLGPRKMRDITLRVTASPGSWVVKADAVQLRQVVVNLLLNAVDAMADNHNERLLELAVGPAAGAPLEFAPPPGNEARIGDYIYIMVRDNGCGMNDATKQRIFEPFFTTKPVGIGTGMGLAMVYGTITNHHGWIQLDTAPGRGAAFCIFMPSAEVDGRNAPGGSGAAQ